MYRIISLTDILSDLQLGRLLRSCPDATDYWLELTALEREHALALLKEYVAAEDEKALRTLLADALRLIAAERSHIRRAGRISWYLDHNGTVTSFGLEPKRCDCQAFESDRDCVHCMIAVIIAPYPLLGHRRPFPRPPSGTGGLTFAWHAALQLVDIMESFAGARFCCTRVRHNYETRMQTLEECYI